MRGEKKQKETVVTFQGLQGYGELSSSSSIKAWVVDDGFHVKVEINTDTIRIFNFTHLGGGKVLQLISVSYGRVLLCLTTTGNIYMASAQDDFKEMKFLLSSNFNNPDPLPVSTHSHSQSRGSSFLPRIACALAA